MSEIEKKSFNPQLYDRVPTYESQTNYRSANRAGKMNMDTYKNSVYFSTCINYIADSIASVDLVVEKKTSEGKWQPDRKSPINDLLHQPNPNISLSTFKNLIAKGIIINGNFLMGKEKKKGVTVNLWPLDVNKIYAERGVTKLVKHYVYYGDQKTRKTISPNDIIHITRLGLDDFIWGESEVALGRRLFDFEQTSFNWNLDILKNHGLVPGIVAVKDVLGPEQVQFIRQQLEERKAGGPYAGEDLIIGADMNYTKLTLSNEDVAWIDGRQMTRDDIFMLMRVPLGLIAPHLAGGDIETQRMGFWQDRINPLLKLIEDTLNAQLVPEFADPKKTRISFDKTKIRAFKDQLFQDTKAFNALVKNGITPRAAAEKIGLSIDEDDIIEGWFDASKYGKPADPNEATNLNPQLGVAQPDNPMNSNRMGEEQGIRQDRPNELLEEEPSRVEEGLEKDAKILLKEQYLLLSKVDEELAMEAVQYLKAKYKTTYPYLYYKGGSNIFKALEEFVTNEKSYKESLPLFMKGLEEQTLKLI